MRIKSIITLIMLLPCSHLLAGPNPWNSVTIFPEQPLEAKLGVLSESNDPTALGIVLWNDGASNRLDAVMIPPPYDGTNLDTEPLDSAGVLFALGDICTSGSDVVVPYIKNFNIETARFDGLDWTFQTIPGTVASNYDNADCMVTNAGIVVAGHDLNNASTELFRSTNGGQSYTFYGRYTGVSGPFDGGLREPLTSTFAGRYFMGLNQQPNGQIRATRVDTATNPPGISHTNITLTSPPPGTFQFVKESGGRFLNGRFYFSYNADGTERVASIPVDNPSAFTSRTIGPVPSAGTGYTFFGGSLIGARGIDGESKVFSFFNAFREFDEDLTLPGAVDGDYPLSGVGGPADACVVEIDGAEQLAIFIGAAFGANSTALHMRPVGSPPIFSDGFESGDVSAWTQCD